MRARGDVKRAALVVLTSSRGLCGGFNTNVLRAAIGHLDGETARGVENDVYMVGKKGVSYFRFLRRPILQQITHIGDTPRFEHVEPIANALMDRFIKGEVSAVMPLLPITTEGGEKAAGERKSTAQYEFSPSAAELLADLLPATVRVRLFQCFTDATVSEQIARMVAMKAATEAAADMITALTRKYNRARQTQITMELLDIVGGANALA
jgi:F-type H+-transporting ATPase subunit gamma